ncbi:MAG: sodium:solute symporter family protein [Alphaproteobacteria bacterium]|nr:sodium:solute symporter family protein [Alphaproteobacteria bacterium]
MNYILLSIVLYLGLLLFIAFWHKRKGRGGNEDFLIADRKLSGLPVAMSILASAIGGGTIMANSALIMNYGWLMIPFVFALPLGLFLIKFFTKRIHELSKKERWFTFYDMLSSRFGVETKYLVSVIQIISLFLIACVALIGGAKMLEFLIGYSYEISIFLMAIVICFYLLISGFSSVVKTDFIQGILIIVLFSLLAIFSFGSGGGMETYSNLEFTHIDPFVAFLFFIVALFYFFGDEGTFQRIFASKNVEEVDRGIKISVLFYILFNFCLVFTAFRIKMLFPELEINDTTFLRGMVDLIPVGLHWLVAISVLSIVLSSIDTYVFASVMNFNKIFLDNKGGVVNHSLLVKRTKLLIPLFLGLMVLIALYIKSILHTVYFYAALTFLNSIIVIIGLLFSKANKWYAICPIVINLLLLLLMIALKGFGNYMIMIPFVSIILGTFLAVVINKVKK